MTARHLYLRVFSRKIHLFHFFGLLGFIGGVITGFTAGTLLLELNPYVILLMVATGVATFFALVYFMRWMTGGENIVYYHHEISILVFCALVLFAIGVPVLPYLDITILGIGVFIVFGRIGCFAVGCCHGRPCKHGIKYGQAHVDAGFTWYYRDITLFPVPLVESLYVAIIVISGLIILPTVAPGTILLVYTAVYGLLRFLLEFFRGDRERPSFQGLSEAQWTTIGLLIVTLGIGMIGWLPLYTWHFVILSVVLFISLVVVLYYRRKEKYILFRPGHIGQIADGLRILGQIESASDHTNRSIAVYTTRAGLCLSCGTLSNQDHAPTVYYTVSRKNGPQLHTGSVRKIAGLISLFTKSHNDFSIIKKDKGIYHIILSKKANGEIARHEIA